VLRKVICAVLLVPLVITLVLAAGQRPVIAGTGDQEKTSWFQYSWLDRLLASPLHAIADALHMIAGWLKLKPVEDLVFNTGAGNPSPMADAFGSDEWYKLVLPWHRAVLVFATSVIFIQSVILLKSYGAALNPAKRVNLQETLFNMAFAVLFAFGTPVILRLILDANRAIVGFARAHVLGMGMPLAGTADPQMTGSALMDAFVRIADVGLMIYINILYLVRKFLLGILVVIAPVVAWAWVSRSTRMPMLLLLSELVTNGLMTASHALPYAFFVTMLSLRGGLLGTALAKLLGFTLIIPVSAFLRRMLIGWLDWLGMHEESMGGAAAGGVAALASLGVIAMGVFRGATQLAPKAAARLAGAAGARTVSAAPAPDKDTGTGAGGIGPGSSAPVSSGISQAGAAATNLGSLAQRVRVKDGIPYDPAPSAVNPLIRYEKVNEPNPFAEEKARAPQPSEAKLKEGSRENTGENVPGRGRRVVGDVLKGIGTLAGASMMAAGVGARIGGTLISLSAGQQIGRGVAGMGEPLYSAGSRMVRELFKRPVTADQLRYWRQTPHGAGGSDAAAQSNSKAH